MVRDRKNPDRSRKMIDNGSINWNSGSPIPPRVDGYSSEFAKSGPIRDQHKTLLSS